MSITRKSIFIRYLNFLWLPVNFVGSSFFPRPISVLFFHFTSCDPRRFPLPPPQRKTLPTTLHQPSPVNPLSHLHLRRRSSLPLAIPSPSIARSWLGLVGVDATLIMSPGLRPRRGLTGASTNCRCLMFSKRVVILNM